MKVSPSADLLSEESWNLEITIQWIANWELKSKLVVFYHDNPNGSACATFYPFLFSHVTHKKAKLQMYRYVCVPKDSTLLLWTFTNVHPVLACNLQWTPFETMKLHFLWKRSSNLVDGNISKEKNVFTTQRIISCEDFGKRIVFAQELILKVLVHTSKKKKKNNVKSSKVLLVEKQN